MARRRLGLLVLLLALAGGAVATRLGREATPGAPSPPEPAADSTAPTAPRLAGRAPDEAPSPPPAGPLLAGLASDDAATRADALSRLRARLKAGDLTLGELLDVSLLPSAEGPTELLRARVLKALIERGPDALPLLDRLLTLLEGGEEHERDVAARVVRSLCGAAGFGPHVTFSDGTDARPVVASLRPFLPRIEALLTDEDTRLAVLPLLHVLGGEAAASAPVLIAWIQDMLRARDEFQRANPNIHVSWHHTEFEIAEVLSALGAGALPAILEALAAEKAPGEYSLLLAIRNMGPDAQVALKELLHHDDPDIRAEALVAVATNAKGEPETLQILRVAMRDGDADVREAAVGRLRDVGAEAGPDLIAALSDEDDGVRAAAARALAHVPEAAASALPRLLDMLASEDYWARLGTLGPLKELGPAAAAAAPGVLALLAEHRASDALRDMLGDTIRDTLTALGPDAVPAILAAAGGADPKLRRAAVDALLAREDLQAEDVLPLASVLPGLEGADRMRLAALLAAHDHPDATRTLVLGLSSDDRATQTAAAEGLQHAGPEAVGVLTPLVEGLRARHATLHADGANWSEEWDSYYAFYLAVVHVGAMAPAELLPLLADENADIAEAATRGVGEAGEVGVSMLEAHWRGIPPNARVLLVGVLATHAFAEAPSRRALALLEGALEDPDAGVRLAAARASSTNASLFPRAVEAYLRLLAVPEEEAAQDAAWQLRKLGARLAPWEAELRAARPEAESTVRRWVQDALDRIEDAR